MGVARYVGEVGDPAEHALPAQQFKGLACRTHRTGTGQRQDDPFTTAGVERVNTSRFQLQHPQGRTFPAGPLGIDVDGVRPARGTASRQVVPASPTLVPAPVPVLAPVLPLVGVRFLVRVLPLLGVMRRHDPCLPVLSSDTAVSTARVTSPSTG